MGQYSKIAEILRKRVTGAVADVFLLLLFSGVITVICNDFLGADPDKELYPSEVQLVLQICLIIFFIRDGTYRKATWGMRSMGLVYSAKNPGWARIAFRVFLGLALAPLALLSIITAIFFQMKSLADLICSTNVEFALPPAGHAFEVVPLTKNALD